MKSDRIHIWIPDYASGMGGIQIFSRFFIRAVAECLPRAKLTVISKNDISFPQLPSANGRSEFRSSGWWSPRLRTFAYTSQLFSNALRQQPDFVLSTHVNFTPVALWLKRLRGTRYAAVAHGVDVWGRGTGPVCTALQRADRVMAVSRFTRERLVSEMKLAAGRIGVLPNTIDPDAFVPGPKPRYLLKRFGLKPEQPVILTVSRLASAERYKGYDQVLRALPAVRAGLPNVHYILGGRGPDRDRIEALIRELKLENAVTLAGYVPDHELLDFYNLCDVFAMPSKGEGFGIVYLEAMACGKPVIAGNKDGSADALLDGELGVLVDPDNVSEISTALTKILSRQHPLAILREPELLREKVVAAYGFERFRKIVAENLTSLGLLN